MQEHAYGRSVHLSIVRTGPYTRPRYLIFVRFLQLSLISVQSSLLHHFPPFLVDFIYSFGLFICYSDSIIWIYVKAFLLLYEIIALWIESTGMVHLRIVGHLLVLRSAFFLLLLLLLLLFCSSSSSSSSSFLLFFFLLASNFGWLARSISRVTQTNKFYELTDSERSQHRRNIIIILYWWCVWTTVWCSDRTWARSTNEPSKTLRDIPYETWVG